MFHVKPWSGCASTTRCWSAGTGGSTWSRARAWRTPGTGTSPNSAQFWALRPPGARTWLDLGAGAGFPGLVVAILAADAEPGLAVALVESDERKAAFLEAAAAACGVAATVHRARIEALPPQAAEIVSARALAPLDRLLEHVEKHRRPDGRALFAKGETVHNEIAGAAARWRFDHRIHPSRTDPHAAILEIGALARA